MQDDLKEQGTKMLVTIGAMVIATLESRLGQVGTILANMIISSGNPNANQGAWIVRGLVLAVSASTWMVARVSGSRQCALA